MAAPGASRPLRRIPAIVSFLNPRPTLSFVGGYLSSCPEWVIQLFIRPHLWQAQFGRRGRSAGGRDSAFA